jgi:hypothetical protein
MRARLPCSRSGRPRCRTLRATFLAGRRLFRRCSCSQRCTPPRPSKLARFHSGCCSRSRHCSQPISSSISYSLSYYINAGYFHRDLRLTVFLNDLFLALGLVAIIECARSCYASLKEATGWERTAYGSGAVVVAFGLAGVVVYWVSLQIFLFRKLPPEPCSISIVSTPPFRGGILAALAHGSVPFD